MRCWVRAPPPSQARCLRARRAPAAKSARPEPVEGPPFLERSTETDRNAAPTARPAPEDVPGARGALPLAPSLLLQPSPTHLDTTNHIGYTPPHGPGAAWPACSSLLRGCAHAARPRRDRRGSALREAGSLTRCGERGRKAPSPSGHTQPVQRTGGCGAVVQPRGSAPMKSGSGPAWPPRAALLIPELILRDSLRTRCGTRAVARDTSPRPNKAEPCGKQRPRRPLARAFTALLRAAPGNGARAGRAGPFRFPKALGPGSPPDGFVCAASTITAQNARREPCAN